MPPHRSSAVAPARPAGSLRVVAGALGRIRQHAVGFGDLPEPLLRVRLGADVRMVAAGQLAERVLDRLGAGITRDAEHLVEVARETVIAGPAAAPCGPRPAGRQAKTGRRACPGHTGRHPGAHAGVSRPCGEHRMCADCRAHAQTLAMAPSPALQSIGHPHRDLRPGQVHQRASGPACCADRGAVARSSHPGRRRPTGLRCRYAFGMSHCPDRGCRQPEMRSQRQSPAASPLPCCGDRLSGFNLERVQPHPKEYSGGLRRLPRCGRRTRTVGRRGKPAARAGPGAGRRRRRGWESSPHNPPTLTCADCGNKRSGRSMRHPEYGMWPKWEGLLVESSIDGYHAASTHDRYFKYLAWLGTGPGHRSAASPGTWAMATRCWNTWRLRGPPGRQVGTAVTTEKGIEALCTPAGRRT